MRFDLFDTTTYRNASILDVLARTRDVVGLTFIGFSIYEFGTIIMGTRSIDVDDTILVMEVSCHDLDRRPGNRWINQFEKIRLPTLI